MSNESFWSAMRVTEAMKTHPSVTEAVAERMKELLRSKLSERPLSATEQAESAKALLAEMVAPAKLKAKS